MTNGTFILGLAISCSLMVVWACKTLPAESWQIFAAIPIAKDAEGHWRGINFTYYGLLTANAAIVSVALLFIFMTALRIPLPGVLALIVTELALCLPSAKLIARIVEKKECTFTVAGAFFVGLVTMPWAIALVNWAAGDWFGFPVPITPTMAAICIAYAFGEGLGRLACISFGCCYGKPLSHLPLVVQRIFDRWHFVFSGKTKKIAYASGLEGERVLPVQAITAVLYLLTGLTTAILFLRADYTTALIITVSITQGWRVVSEMFRADYRGTGRISTYQTMGLLSIPYAIWLPTLFPSFSPSPPNITLGFQSLWNPWVVLFLQGLWCTLFVFFGKSMVTGSAISFHLHEDRI